MPKRIDQARPFLTLGVVVAAWLVLPVVVKSVLRASFFELTAPVAATASYVRDLQEYWSLRLHTRSELIEAGRDLARVNASYALSVQQNSELQAEIARLEQALRLPPQPRYRMEPARVAQRNFSAWWQVLVIRKGRNFGIPVGAPVVFTDGVVGRVSEVHAYASVVELISSPNVRLAAVIEGDTRPVAYQGGDNPTFGPAMGTVEFVPLEIFAQPTIPRRLVTSGLGGEFPPGLTIGELVRVAPSADGLFKTGQVRLDPRLAELTEVTVLVPEQPNSMRRALATFFTLVLLWALVAQINHELARLHLYLFEGGLFVAYASLALPWRAGFATVLAAGMLCDANAGAPFGTQTLLFAATSAVLFHLRDRLPYDRTSGRVVIALLANAALFLTLSLLQVSRESSAAPLWPRLGFDLVVSELFLALAAPWFFALQVRALVLARAEPERLL